MGLIELILIIALTGLCIWAITTIIPMPAQFKTAIYVLSVVFLVFYILSALGLFHNFHDIRIGK